MTGLKKFKLIRGIWKRTIIKNCIYYETEQ